MLLALNEWQPGRRQGIGAGLQIRLFFPVIGRIEGRASPLISFRPMAMNQISPHGDPFVGQFHQVSL